MQSWSLNRKIQVTQTRIMEFYNYFNGQVYISFSGGKDSSVLLDIARKMYPGIQAVFMDTGLEYPELKSFIKTFDNVTIEKPKMGFKDVIRTYGYPIISKEIAETIQGARKGQQYRIDSLNGVRMKNGKISPFGNYPKYKYLLDAPFNISHYCCNEMKKKPFHIFENKYNLHPIIGTRVDESLLRRNAWLKTGCNAFDSDRPISKPISFWTEQNILEYINKFKTPICSLYGEVIPVKDTYHLYFGGTPDPDQYKTTGIKSSGCIFCCFGISGECKYPDDLNRFEKLKLSHQQLYNYCINGGELKDGLWVPNKNGLGLGFVLDFIGEKY